MELIFASARKLIGRLKRKLFRLLDIAKIRKSYKRAKKAKFDIRPYIRAMLTEQANDVTDFVNPVRLKLSNGLNSSQGLSKEYIETLLKTIHEKWNSPDRTTEIEDVLRSMTVAYDANLLPAPQWLAVYNACLSFGLLSVLEPLRANAIESANIDEKKHPDNYRSVEQAFRVAMEQGNFQKAEDLLKRLGKLLNDRDTLLNYQVYYQLQTGQRVEASKPARELVRNHDYRDCFRKLVEGKRIAVVGPAPTGEQTGKEIDDYDLVVRMTYRGSDRVKDTNEFGRRTDISYYNSEYSRFISTLQNRKFFDDLKFAVFKGAPHQYQEELLKRGVGRFVRKPNLFFNGVPNQVPSISHDLLLFEPKEVKLFKVNFYLSEKPFHDGYRDSHLEVMGNKIRSTDWSMLYSFTLHDVLSQLSFVRNLVNAGMIHADDSCHRVLFMNSGDYLRELERIYVRNANWAF
jgi:hypothetical protein